VSSKPLAPLLLLPSPLFQLYPLQTSLFPFGHIALAPEIYQRPSLCNHNAREHQMLRCAGSQGLAPLIERQTAKVCAESVIASAKVAPGRQRYKRQTTLDALGIGHPIARPSRLRQSTAIPERHLRSKRLVRLVQRREELTTLCTGGNTLHDQSAKVGSAGFACEAEQRVVVHTRRAPQRAYKVSCHVRLYFTFEGSSSWN
jgi:hypothetical protein